MSSEEIMYFSSFLYQISFLRKTSKVLQELPPQSTFVRNFLALLAFALPPPLPALWHLPNLLPILGHKEVEVGLHLLKSLRLLHVRDFFIAKESRVEREFFNHEVAILLLLSTLDKWITVILEEQMSSFKFCYKLLHHFGSLLWLHLPTRGLRILPSDLLFDILVDRAQHFALFLVPGAPVQTLALQTAVIQATAAAANFQPYKKEQ